MNQLAISEHLPDSATQRTLASVLTETIRGDIIAGVLPPNSKLRLKELADRYEVGVNPLREALSRLATSGFVNAEDQRGFSVTGISRDELLDITQTRQRIECDALRDAIAHGDVEWEGRILASLHRLSKLPMTAAMRDAGLHPAWEAAHDAFHEALLSGCKSKWSLKFALILRDQTSRYRHLSVRTRTDGDRDVLAEHKAIADATLSKDVERACALLSEHFQTTTSLVLSQT